MIAALLAMLGERNHANDLSIRAAVCNVSVAAPAVAFMFFGSYAIIIK